MKTASQRSG